MPLKKLKFIDGLEEETRKTAISGRTNRETHVCLFHYM